MLAASDLVVVTAVGGVFTLAAAIVSAIAAVKASRQTRSDGVSAAEFARATHDLLRTHIETPTPFAHTPQTARRARAKRGDAS